MSGNGVKVISAVMAEMLHEESVEMVTVMMVMMMMMIGSGSGSRSRSRRSWYKSSHTTDSVWASYPTQRSGNIR